MHGQRVRATLMDHRRPRTWLPVVCGVRVPAQNQEKFRLERPCKCGAWCCCPLELTVKSGASTIGRVEEDCSWCSGRVSEGD